MSEVLKSSDKENILDDLSSQHQSSGGSFNPSSRSEQKDERKLQPNPESNAKEKTEGNEEQLAEPSPEPSPNNIPEANGEQDVEPNSEPNKQAKTETNAESQEKKDSEHTVEQIAKPNPEPNRKKSRKKRKTEVPKNNPEQSARPYPGYDIMEIVVDDADQNAKPNPDLLPKKEQNPKNIEDELQTQEHEPNTSPPIDQLEITSTSNAEITPAQDPSPKQTESDSSKEVPESFKPATQPTPLDTIANPVANSTYPPNNSRGERTIVVKSCEIKFLGKTLIDQNQPHITAELVVNQKTFNLSRTLTEIVEILKLARKKFPFILLPSFPSHISAFTLDKLKAHTFAESSIAEMSPIEYKKSVLKFFEKLESSSVIRGTNIIEYLSFSKSRSHIASFIQNSVDFVAKQFSHSTEALNLAQKNETFQKLEEAINLAKNLRYLLVCNHAQKLVRSKFKISIELLFSKEIEKTPEERNSEDLKTSDLIKQIQLSKQKEQNKHVLLFAIERIIGDLEFARDSALEICLSAVSKTKEFDVKLPELPLMMFPLNELIAKNEKKFHFFQAERRQFSILADQMELLVSGAAEDCAMLIQPLSHLTL